MEGSGSVLRSAGVVLRVFEEVAVARSASLSELVKRLDLPTTNVHRALATLDAAGWIRPQAGSRRWGVAPRMNALVSSRVERLSEVARPHLKGLRDRSGESASLSVIDGDHVLVVEHLEGAQLLRVVQRPGSRVPVALSATGRAALAIDPASDLSALPTRAVREVSLARGRGFAVVRGDRDPQVASVGAVVVDAHGQPVAGLGLSGPIDRVTKRIGELGAEVRDATRLMSEEIQEFG